MPLSTTWTRLGVLLVGAVACAASAQAQVAGAAGPDALAVDLALEQQQAVLPPVVLCELLSAPRLPTRVRTLILQLPLLDVLDGYWERAGVLRARILAKRHKARIADALIAQSCLDHDVPLVSRDRNFRHFSRLAALQILE